VGNESRSAIHKRERDTPTLPPSVEMDDRYPYDEPYFLAQMATDEEFDRAFNDQRFPWNSTREKRALEICRELLPQFIGTTMRQFFEDVGPQISEEMEMELSSNQICDHYRRRFMNDYDDLTEKQQQVLQKDFENVVQQIRHRCKILKGQIWGDGPKPLPGEKSMARFLACQRVNGIMVCMRLNDKFVNLSQIFRSANAPFQLRGQIFSELQRQEGTLDTRYLSVGSELLKGYWVPRPIAIAICQKYNLDVVDLQPLLTFDVTKNLDRTLFSEPLETQSEEEDTVDDLIRSISEE
jgi:hypothetical protein